LRKFVHFIWMPNHRPSYFKSSKKNTYHNTIFKLLKCLWLESELLGFILVNSFLGVHAILWSILLELRSTLAVCCFLREIIVVWYALMPMFQSYSELSVLHIKLNVWSNFHRIQCSG
jgi:hypothetical protein